MQQRQLGNLFSVSARTLGGGGVGQVWGSTSREEGIRTVKAAYEAGITFFDMAPLYGRGEAETVLGPGGMSICEETPRPREVVARAQAHGIGVMGIRAVAAGSLTGALDRELDASSPEVRDFERAQAFRHLALDQGESAASLAHRYALSMKGVDTVVLGVKNRQELEECLASEALGPLHPSLVDRIDGLVGLGSSQ